MAFSSPFATPFARVSSMAEAIRRRKAQKESERVALAQLPRIRVGVCAMDKKANSKPMQAILKRMNLADEFDIVIFGDEVILNKPIKEWPLCQVLLAWHSTGFPLQKAQQYVQLRNPILINDVHQQTGLLDRREVYKKLAEHNVPTPQHIVVCRTEEQAAAGEDPEGFVETPDYVAQGEIKMSKPFVEKPAAADDHNVWIYYPHSMGGGVKMMFRKVGNKSAEYNPEHPGTVRRDGSYIYEEFIATSGTDIKVYTVGSEYAHAEARKSPVVDGKVQRATDGKEIRFPVLLTPQEKEVASIVVQAFRQKVCGFDLLRTDSGQSYVCDVNGWSFVKNSHKYYEDAARILRHMIFQAQSPNTLEMRRPLPQLTLDEELPDCFLPDLEETPEEELEKAEMIHVRQLQAEIEHTNKVSVGRELLCVLAVIRHGDRTPKHKLKLTVRPTDCFLPIMGTSLTALLGNTSQSSVSNKPFLDVFAKYKDSKGRQAKLKAPAELEFFLEAVLQVLPAHYADGVPPETPPEAGPATASPKIPVDPSATPSNATPTATPVTPPRPLPEPPVPTGTSTASMVTTGTLAAAEAMPHTPRTPPHPAHAPFSISQSTDDGGGQGGASGAHSGAGADAELDEAESETAQLAIIRRVLRAGNHFSGINRKVQLKPVAYAEDGSVSCVQVIVKWGGVLTHLGRRQSEELGNIYRMVMYPNSSDGGLLRLHSTYRHDLKIYSSDEGRVQTSAAAFAKGLLDLEGDSLTPVLVSLVKKDAAMLDAFGKGASEDIRRTKEELYRALTRNPETGDFHCKLASDKTLRSLPVSPNRSTTSLLDNASAVGVDEAPFMVVPHAPERPLAKLRALYEAINELLFHLRKHVWHASAFSSERQFSVLNTSDYKQEDLSAPYGTESMLMMWDRWKKLEKAFYNSEADTFDISKIPDIYDSIKFDCIHNSHLRCDYSKVFPIAKELADCVIPAEYGISADHKLRIGKKIAAELIGKLLCDIENSKKDCQAAAYAATGGEPVTATASAARSTLADGNVVVGRGVDVDAVVPGAPDGGKDEENVSSEDAEDEEQEESRVHVLAPFTQNVNSIRRHVRTRIYFTSESHIHSLMNILRHTDLEGRSMLSDEALERFDKAVEFDYLTQIVFRLYECNAPVDEASRFQVEIQFSNGANYNPLVTKVMNDKPRENVHRSESIPLGEFTDHLNPWGSSQRKATAMPAAALSATVGPNEGSQAHLMAPGGDSSGENRSCSNAMSVSDPGGSANKL